MISGQNTHHHDHFSHHVRTKSWGIEPIWKFVGAPAASSSQPETIVHPRRANELRNPPLNIRNHHRGPTTIPIVRSVEIKLVGPLRGRLDNSPTLSSVRRSSVSDSEDTTIRRISPLSSLTSSGGSSSSDDDSVPQTVADVKSIIEQRRSHYANRSFRRNSTPSLTSESRNSVVPLRTNSLPIRPAPNRYSPPSSYDNRDYSPPLPTSKPRKVSPPVVENHESKKTLPITVNNFSRKNTADRSSFRGKQLPSSDKSAKKSHHGDHQRNLINISKFLSNPSKTLQKSSPPPQEPEVATPPVPPPIVPPAIVPPGVLKKPGADKGHRSLKKVAFLENAEFSRGLP